MKPSSYERLQAARVVRPLCWEQSKPHMFKHEGIWRVSLVHVPPKTTRSKKSEGEIARRWVTAHQWLGRMASEGRLP